MRQQGAGPTSPTRIAALALGLVLGTAWQLQQRELPWPAGWVVGAIVVSLVVLGAAWRLPSARPSTFIVLLAAAALTFAATTWRAQMRLAERLPAALEGRDIEVTGVVAQLPRVGLLGTRFLFEVEHASLNGQPVPLPPLLSLGWYRGAEPDALLLGPASELRAGQRWRFEIRLKQPHGAFNPGGFDLELWLFERDIGATGYVRSRAGGEASMLDAAAGAPIERTRQRVRDAIERRIADPARAGVIAALAIGDQAAIERDDWELFRATGVAHLMSISGLHVTMFAWLAAAALGWLWRRSARACLLVPAPMAARWGGVTLALGYALVAGWGVPAQRTVWMLATVALLQSLGRRWPLPLVLLVVAAVVLAIDPWAMSQPGFWLSFVAVALLAASQPATEMRVGDDDDAPASPTLAQRAWTAARAALRQQAVATIGLAPLTLVFFQQISIVGFAANLIAIPVITLLVTPLALLGVLIAPLWDLAAAVLGALMVLLQWLGSAPAAVWQASAAPGWAVVAGLVGGLVAILPLPWRLRLLGLPLMLPLLWPAVPRPAEGEFELIALDVGQGTAVIVRTKDHLLVYDTGPGITPEADAGSRILVPLLRWRGERRIDHLMLSHRDSDHVGGAGAVLAALPVARLSSSLEPSHPLIERARSMPVVLERCEAGQRWSWNGVRFEVLHPRAEDYEVPGNKPNALSCVLRIEGQRTAALLTGDLEAPQEAALLARHHRAALQSPWLFVPHHGSRTSSSAAFLDAIAPQQAIVQAGYRSRFGHPAPEVLARYQSRGIAVQRSDRCGALTLAPDGSHRCEREAARRYWHHGSGR
jgi:competence protein ComEC